MSSKSGQSDVAAVRDATDLVGLIGEHVSLTPRGREHVGLCPFHDDSRPSMAVVTHKGNAFYKCHSCGAGGDAFDFVQNYHKMDFPEALRYLAERAGIELTPYGSRSSSEISSRSNRAQVLDANAFAAEFFQAALNSSAGAKARGVLHDRAIDDQTAVDFMLGAAPDAWDGLHNRVRSSGCNIADFAEAGLLKRRKEGDGCYDTFRNRLVFPICDELGRPIAFGGRIIDPDDEPKYLNSPESKLFNKSATLYGLHLAKRAIIDSRQAIVVEGYTDVIACHQAGLRNVVATLGTALTSQHADVLSKLCDTVVLMLDGDEAGLKAADRAVEVFFSSRIDVCVCALPDNKDPDELLREQGGIFQFQSAVAEAQDALQFKLQRFRSQLDSDQTMSGRQRLLEAFLVELGRLGLGTMQGVRKHMVLGQIADMVGVPVGAVESALPRQRVAPVSHDVEEEIIEPADTLIEVAPRSFVPPLRRRAEHELLAMVIYDPSLRDTAYFAADGRRETVRDMLAASNFLDPEALAIAHALANDDLSETDFAVQDVMAVFEQQSLRQRVSELYFNGQYFCDNATDGRAAAATESCLALRKLIEQEQYQNNVATYLHADSGPDENANALQNLLEQRRKQGYVSNALARNRT